jgi:hypothetical protein
VSTIAITSTICQGASNKKKGAKKNIPKPIFSDQKSNVGISNVGSPSFRDTPNVAFFTAEDQAMKRKHLGFTASVIHPRKII